MTWKPRRLVKVAISRSLCERGGVMRDKRGRGESREEYLKI